MKKELRKYLLSILTGWTVRLINPKDEKEGFLLVALGHYFELETGRKTLDSLRDELLRKTITDLKKK